jgi:hypothetical protein
MRGADKIFLSLAALASAAPAHDPKPFSLFEYKTIWTAPPGVRAFYPRLTELKDGTLLVTTGTSGNRSLAGLSSFPVFESKDGGVSWKQVSNITDQVNGWGMTAQPAITEMTQDVGPYKKGTILASGNSWSFNETAEGVGTKIDLYASRDRARTWEFVSNVAVGGRPNTTNGADPIWEPYLM